jgi:hypothetical protein
VRLGPARGARGVGGRTTELCAKKASVCVCVYVCVCPGSHAVPCSTPFHVGALVLSNRLAKS